MMRKVIHTVLDITYEGLVIERETYNLVDKWMETFTVKGGGDIMTFSNYYNGKGVQYRVNSFLRRKISAYTDLNHDFIWTHVLDWCRRRTMETIEM